MKKRAWCILVVFCLGLIGSTYLFPDLWRGALERLKPGFKIGSPVLGGAILLLIWQKIRRRKLRYRNLYQKLLNQPRAKKDGVKYPPPAAGIEAESLEEILSPQMDLINLIEMTTETRHVFEERYWPAIERYARTVHLLPASAENHHIGPGGLLHHGLEVGLYAMQAGRDGLYGMKMGGKKRDGRERWIFACFMAGLCHDLGKVASDVRVTANSGVTWSPHTESLLEWASKNRVSKYYVDFQPNRYKLHENYTLKMIGKVLTENDSHYISSIDKGLLNNMMMALGPLVESEEGETQSISPTNIRAIVQRADGLSVANDKKNSRTAADMGLETLTPMARHYTEEMKRMFKIGVWEINKTGAAAWVLGEGQDLYLSWPRCALEVYSSLLERQVQGIASEPEIIAETLGSWQIILMAPDGSYYWRIKPVNMDGAPLTVVRVKEDWAMHLVGMLPPGMSGLVETDAEGSSWSYVEPALEQGPVPDNPEIGMDSSPTDLGPEAGKSELELEKNGIWGGMATALFYFCLGFWGVIGYLLYLGKAWYPEYSYPYFMQLLAGDMLRDGYIILLGIIATMVVIAINLYPRWRIKIKKSEAEKQAAAIIEEAGEILDRAKQEAERTKVSAEEGAAEIRADAEQDAADLKAKAKSKAKKTMDEFWQLLQAKARDMGISQEELQGLVKVLQNAKDEAATIMAQAQDKAQQAAKEIIAQAQKEAEAQAKAILHRARVQAANVLLGQDLTPEREHELEAQMQAGEDMEDLVQGTDRVEQAPQHIEIPDAQANYQEIDGFINDCCCIEPANLVQTSILYQAYTDWCLKKQMNPMSQTRFGVELGKRGFERVRGTGGTRHWQGIALK